MHLQRLQRCYVGLNKQTNKKAEVVGVPLPKALLIAEVVIILHVDIVLDCVTS